MNSKDINQESGNYNVFCQSCGRIIAVNIEGHKEALDLEEDHLDNTDCVYAGTHKIEKSSSN